MKDIAVSIVCYNNECEVLGFVKHICNQSLINRIQLIVTCNHSDNYSMLRNNILDILPSAIVFNPNRNLGYLNGCLFGLENADTNYSWAMICNTDISFFDNYFFEELLKTVNQDVWCVGPDIVLTRNKDHQNPFLITRPSKKKWLIWNIVYSNYVFYLLYQYLHRIKEIKRKPNCFTTSENVYALHGSCFLLREDCVELLIKEKPSIFMYEEELLIAELIRENNKKCYYNSNARIKHNENQVTGIVNSKRKQLWFNESIKYILNRFVY